MLSHLVDEYCPEGHLDIQQTEQEGKRTKKKKVCYISS